MRLPWLVTVAILLLALTAFRAIPDIQIAAYLGEVLAAVTSAIAVVWLIAGIRQQRDEIRLQRTALENQRQELELQRAEIEKLGRYSALTQVNALLEQFSKTLRERGIPNCNTVEELPSALAAAMPELRVVLDDQAQPSDVIAAYGRWGRAEGACLQFLACLRICYGLYLDAAGGRASALPDDDIELFTLHSNRLEGIPFLSDFRGKAELVATTLKAGEAYRLVAQFRFMRASEQLYPGFVKPGAWEELQNRIAQLRQQRPSGALEDEAPKDEAPRDREPSA